MSDIIKLIITAQESDPQEPYISLSHSWGGATITTLTSHNLDLFRQGIQLSSLPETFQHTVTVARSLNIRYV
jgi:hypothetical protein